MNKEEYRLHTSISGAEEARALLNKSKVLFTIVFLYMAFLKILIRTEPQYHTIIFITYLGILGYFVFHCVQIIKKTKEVTKADAIFSIIFAPISWIWFYPALVEPLKVITGDLPVPSELPAKTQLTKEQKRLNWKNTLITVAKITGIAFVLMMLLAILMGLSK